MATKQREETMTLRVTESKETFEKIRGVLNPTAGGGGAQRTLSLWERRAKRQMRLGIALLLGMFTLGFVLGAVLL